MKSTGPGLLFVVSFLITASISLIAICLFRCSDSSSLSLEDCVFLGIYLFCPDSPLCWYIIVCNIFYNPLCFFGARWDLYFISDLIYLGPLSSFLNESG